MEQNNSSLPKKNPLSMQIDLDKFAPATEEEKRQQEQRKHIVYTHHYAAQFIVQPVCIAQNKGDYAIVHLPKCADGEKCESY